MYTRRIATRGIIFDGEKILAVKHRDENGEPVAHWATPGGGLDPNESLHEGLTRELIEETGVAPEIGELLFIQQFFPGDDREKEQLEFFFHVKNAEDYRTIDLKSTTHGFQELGAVGFVDPKVVEILPTIISEIDLKKHIENGEPTIIANYLG